MEIIKDDIFNGNEDLIVHQVNCQGVMGSGIAKQIKKLFPANFNAYYAYCKTNTVENLLGTALICEISEGKYIANVFGQVNYGKGIQTDYNALRAGLLEVFDFAKERNLSIAIPYKIGCGLGGGDWKIVSEFIEEIFAGSNTKLYKKGR